MRVTSVAKKEEQVNGDAKKLSVKKEKRYQENDEDVMEG